MLSPSYTWRFFVSLNANIWRFKIQSLSATFLAIVKTYFVCVEILEIIEVHVCKCAFLSFLCSSLTGGTRPFNSWLTNKISFALYEMKATTTRPCRLDKRCNTFKQCCRCQCLGFNYRCNQQLIIQEAFAFHFPKSQNDHFVSI